MVTGMLRGEKKVSPQLQVMLVLLVFLAIMLGSLTNKVHEVMSKELSNVPDDEAKAPSWNGVWGSFLVYCLAVVILGAQMLGDYATVVTGWVFGPIIFLSVVALLIFGYRTRGESRLVSAFAQAKAEADALSVSVATQAP